MKTKMRLFAAVVAALGAMALVPAAAGEEKENAKASIRFEERVHDFGIVPEKGGPVSCEFEFENAGGGNLVIVSATAQCGCTKPEFPQNPIAPGKRGKVKVTYHPLGRPGGFDKTVTVVTNGKPKKVGIKIRGSVAPE